MIDPKINEAVEATKRIAKSFQAVLDVAAALESIVVLDEAVSSHQRAADEARAELEAVAGQVTVAKAELAGAQYEVKQARAEAKQAVDQASADARRIAGEAAKSAEDVRDAANKEAAKVRERATAELNAHLGRLATFETAEKDARDAVEKHRNALKQVREQLSALAGGAA